MWRQTHSQSRRGGYGRGFALPITRRAKGLTGDDDRGESLPDESVDDLDRRAAWAARGQGVGSPRRVSHDVAARSHVGGVDSSARHEWSERLADLVSIAGVPDESRAQSVRVAAAIGPLRSLAADLASDLASDLSHQARHDALRGVPARQHEWQAKAAPARRQHDADKKKTEANFP